MARNMVNNMPNRPLVYVIVLNYCSFEDTLECVKKIRNIDYPNFRLLVIDNNSPDGSGKKLAEVLSGHELVRSKVNTGYAGGNNLGMKLAISQKAEFVLIVNPDVRLPSDCLFHYISVFEKKSTLGALNPVQLEPNQNGLDNRFKKVVMKNVPFKKEDLFGPEFFFTETLFGAAIIFSVNVLNSVGLFDPLYFAYGEESDLCRRIKYHGYDLGVTFLSPVIHHRNYSDSSDSLSNFRNFLRLKGKYLFLLKNINADMNFCFKDFYYTLRQDFKNIKNRTSQIGIFNFFKALTWIATRFPFILRNRKHDKAGESYLQ